MNTKRLNYLDMAKGIGIILVVIGHSGFASDHLVTWLASFHMPLFFIISGMLLRYKREEEKICRGVIKKKALAIMVPYVVFSIIYLFIDIIYILRQRDINLGEAAVQFVSLYGISVLWFLPALFMGEVAFLFIRKKTSHPITLLLCVILCLGAVIFNQISGDRLSSGQNLFLQWLGDLILALIRVGFAIAFLTMGYYSMYLAQKLSDRKLFRYLSGKKGIANSMSFLAAAVLFGINGFLGAWNGRVDMRLMIFQNVAVYFLAAYCGSMAVVLLCRALPSIKPLSYLGVNSLAVMVTHLDCGVLYLSHCFAFFVKNYITFTTQYIFYFNVAVSILVMELVIIYVLNHYLPFLLGRSGRPGNYSSDENRIRKS